MTFGTYARFSLAPAVLVAGCSGDDAAADASSSDGATTPTTGGSDTIATAADTSSSGSSEASSSTDVTQGASESSSTSSEGSSTGVTHCGDGVIEGSEQCDGDDVAGADCVSVGFPLGGELACNEECDGYVLSGCIAQLCGNDIIEGTEVCDGTALDGDTCAAHGLAGGRLGCNASCTAFDYASCSPGNAQFVYVANDTTPNSISAYAVDSDGVLSEIAGSPFATDGNSGFDHHPDAIVSCGPYLYVANTISGDISGFFVESDGSLTAIAGSPFAQTGVMGLSCNDGFLFATTFDDSVSRFAIADDGALAALGTVGATASTLGTTVDRAASRLFVASFADAIDVYDIDDVGDPSAVPGSPFLHSGTNYSVSVSPDGAFAASEGNEGVRVWSVAGDGALAEIAGSPFADTTGCEVVGLAWAPDGSRLFVGHRACAPGQISVYDVADDGALAQVAGSPFASGGDDTVGLALSPDGERLFATHMATSATSVFDVSDSGTLSHVAGSPFINGVDGNHSWIAVRGGPTRGCHAPFGAPSYDTVVIFADAPGLVDMRMPIAWDGAEYWAASGGMSDVNNIAEIDAAGVAFAYYNPGYDLRAAFTKTDGVGPIYYRAYADPVIYVQTGPGALADDVTLVGGTLDDEAAVVFDDDNRYFISHSNGTVSRWDESGAHVDDITLLGWGTQGTESLGIQARGIAWACGYFYTYSDGNLSAWDTGGNRVATTVLEGASTSNDAYYSYSIANGLFFVDDGLGGIWRGYDAI